VTLSEQNPVHTFSEPETYAVKLTGTNTYGSGTAAMSIVVQAPPALPPHPDFIWTPMDPEAWQTVQFTDTSTDDTGIAGWSWDFDGDGVTDAVGATPTHVFTSAGTATVTLTVTDTDGSTGAVTTEILVAAPVAATYEVGAPGVTVGDQGFVVDTTQVESAGGTVEVVGNQVIIGYDGLVTTITTTQTIEPGAFITGEVAGVAVASEPLPSSFDETGPVEVSFAASFTPDFLTSAEGASITTTVAQTVDESVLDAFQMVAVSEGTTIQAIAYTMVIEKTGIPAGAVGGASITMSAGEAWVTAQGGPDKIRIFRRADDGTTQMLVPTTIKLEQGVYTFVADSPGLSVFGLVAVEDSPPGIGPVAVTPNPAPLDTELVVTAEVDDRTPISGGIASVSCSLDGADPEAVIPDDGAYEGEITETITIRVPPFASAGVHSLEIRATDGAHNTAIYPILIAVYDPAAGFVTGGGWIESPAGAYAADPGGTGKVSFGFVSKFLKGVNVPTGETQFVFPAADFAFRSTGYDWLVVSGAKAQFRGSGTVNGGGDYGFMLTAIDGDILGKGRPDLLRVKVWSKATGAVVYDNEMGAGDSDDPTTIIGGGSIVVHRA
jgi:PKD repeat protein